MLEYLQPGDHGGAIPGSKRQALATGLFQKFVPSREGRQELRTLPMGLTWVHTIKASLKSAVRCDAL